MKKINTNCEVGKSPHVTKLWRVMKITGLLLLIAFIQVSASTYSQTAQMSLNLKNATLSEVLENIEK